MSCTEQQIVEGTCKPAIQIINNLIANPLALVMILFGLFMGIYGMDLIQEHFKKRRQSHV